MIVGHQKQLQFLKKSAEAKKISHAYLFAGPDKVGKKAAALEWLSGIFGVKISEGTVHPDLFFVRPDSETNNIKIETIRNLIWKLSLKPVSAPIKVAVIDQAHLMNKDSQNCLLKTLEEPSGNALLILTAENSQLLLPTIVSRCELIRFNFVPQSDIKNYLSKLLATSKIKKAIPQETLQEVIKLSFGRPGRAVDFISNPELLEKWRTSIKELSHVLSGDLAERFKYAKKISESPNINEILEIWQFYFRNLMLTSLNGENEKKAAKPAADLPKQFEFSKAKDEPYPLPKLKEILKNIYQTNYLIATTNVNTKLALENLMLEI